MSWDGLPVLIGLGAWLLLAVAALTRQRLGRADYLKLGLLWTAIIGTVWVLAAYAIRQHYFT